MGAGIPEICGFDCPHADFPPADTAGICRTMSAVWCGKLKALVNKNVACTWRKSTSSKKTTKRTGVRKSAAKRPARRR